MKFSNETLSVLKNFSTINPGVLLKKGNKIRTVSPQKTVMAVADIEQDIEKDAGIFDIGRFLSSLTLFDDPDIMFGDDRFVIDGLSAGGNFTRKLSYTYTPANMIVTPGDKDIVLPSSEATIEVKWSDIESVIRAAGTLQLPEILFYNDGERVIMSAVNTDNPTADNFSVVISEGEFENEFKLVVKVENMRMMPNDYTLELSKAGIIHFKSEKVQYWIAVDSK